MSGASIECQQTTLKRIDRGIQAGLTVTFDEHIDYLSYLGVDVHLDLRGVQAPNSTAINAKQVGVHLVFTVIGSFTIHFVPPNVVAQFQPSEQFSLGQVLQSAKDGRLV
jgi:hypothetical protein